MSAIRVLLSLVGLNSSMGGVARSVTSLCSALGDAGAEVWLVSEDWRKKEDPLVLPASERVKLCLVKGYHSDRLRASYSPSLAKTLRELCAEQKIEIVHDNLLWLPFNHIVSRTAREFKIPHLVSPRGTLEPWSLSYRAAKKRVAWKLFVQKDLAAVTMFHATARREASSIREIGLAQPVSVIPNGVHVPDCVEGLDHPDRSRTALFLSRIHPIKGLLNLVSAWERARPANWRVVVAGPDEGGHRKIVERAVHDAGLQKDFSFAGPVEGAEKEALYRGADLFILPTFSENFGIVVAEALSYGVPVITTRGAPWQGLVTHRCGWWIAVGVEPLSVAIREATAIPDEALRSMGARGRHYVKTEFSWPHIAQSMLHTYEWVLGRSPSPPEALI